MTNRILVGVVFLVGCGVGGVSSQFVVPKASAEQEAKLLAWEYKCVMQEYRWTDTTETADTTEKANRLGAARWEAFAIDSKEKMWCFKRPKM
jgi:hypothetical protein